MKRIVIIIVAILVAAFAVLQVRSHLRQTKVRGLWSAPSGASVQFSVGTVTIHPPSVAAGGSPSAPPVISGDYKILDGSHLQITVSNYAPVTAEYSVSGDILRMTTVADGPMTYTRAGH